MAEGRQRTRMQPIGLAVIGERSALLARQAGTR